MAITPEKEAEFLELVKTMQAQNRRHPRPEPSNSEALRSLVGAFADDATWDEFIHAVNERREREYDEANREADAASNNEGNTTPPREVISR